MSGTFTPLKRLWKFLPFTSQADYGADLQLVACHNFSPLESQVSAMRKLCKCHLYEKYLKTQSSLMAEKALSIKAQQISFFFHERLVINK